MNNLSVKSVNQSARSVTLGALLRDFNFSEPDWNRLPPEFPYCDTTELSRIEKHYLSGIKLAWTATTEKGKQTFYKRVGYISMLILAVMSTGTIILNIFKSPGFAYASQISAATVSATFRTTSVNAGKATNEIIESTQSAIFKNKF